MQVQNLIFFPIMKMNFLSLMLLCRGIVWIIVWHKCDSYNKEHLWIVTLQENVYFSWMKWKKSLKIGGKVLQLVLNTMEKEKMLNVWVKIGLRKNCLPNSFLVKNDRKIKGKSIIIQIHFLSSYSWNIEFKLSTHINGLIVTAYKLLDDPHWHFLIG